MGNLVNYKQNGVELNLNRNDGQNYIQSDPFYNLVSPNKGLKFPQSQYIYLAPREVNFQPNTLGNTQHIYQSPTYSDINSLADYFADWGCAYTIKEGPAHTITVQIPWDTVSSQDFYLSNYVSEQWELIPNQDQKSILTNGILANPFNPPTTTGNYVVLPDVLKVGVQRAFENKALTITIPPSSFSSSLAPFIPYAKQTLNYLRGGIEGVPSYTQTLKRTAVVDKRNTNRAFQKAADVTQRSLNAAGTINYVLSTRDMVNRYEVPLDTVAQFMMPSYRKLITVTGQEPTNYWSYAGWVVKPPHFQFITRNKVQITQEFLWNEWIQGLYYILSPATDFVYVANPSSNPNGSAPN